MSSSSPLGMDFREIIEGLRDALNSDDVRRWTPSLDMMTPEKHLRSMILRSLVDGPKNGYQIVQAVGELRGGAWVASARNVYPLLQQLVDEQLLQVGNDGERPVYNLTDDGRSAAEKSAESAPGAGTGAGWPDMSRLGRDLRGPVPRSAAKLAQAVAQAAQSGSREQRERVATLLDETRRAIYAILAED